MNWGIIGTGKIANKTAETLSFLNNEGERLVAVASRSMEKAEEFKNKYNADVAYGSYGHIYKDENVDALYIATPNNLHYEEIKEALLNGKHVLAEKPMTLKPEEIRELYALAEEKGLFLMEAYWVYFLPGAFALREKYKEIGEIEEISLTYGFFSEGKRRERKFLSSLGGGALLDIGIYNLGIVEMLGLENPEIINTKVMMNEFGTDKWSETNLLYGKKTKVRTLNAIGEDIERVCTIKGEKGSIYIPDFQYLTSFSITTSNETTNYSFPLDFNGFEYEIRHTSKCVEENMTSSPIFTKEKSIDIAETLYRIRKLWNMKFEGIDND
ncbi:MAG: Gfo/Idh/MocA family protein [Candidatus Ornithospirochaeta sp.]